MKTMIAVIIGSIWCVASANAQYIVYDPTLNVQNAINQVANIAKYVEMIDNQIQQINTLTSQLQELQHYSHVFGDPSQIVNLAGVNTLVQDLQNTGVGQTLGSLQNLSQGVDAFTYNASGLYQSVGETFRTPNGNTISREQDLYRPFSAINHTTQNFSDVYADVIARRKELKLNIAATTEQLQSATTASEAQKLTGVLIGLNSSLVAADKELDQALDLSLVQDVENRNDQQKQQQAHKEEQEAEFIESVQKYGDTITPSVEPASFQATH